MNLTTALDVILHVDKYLITIIQNYGGWTYGLLFLIFFCETGLVITPFLPGDSLLFASGTFAAQGTFNPVLLFFLLSLAAILGDSVNYALGKSIGERVFKHDVKYINRHYLEHAKKFYDKHGAKAIVLARFVPIVRTFAPFVAGVTKMNYRTFITYNIIGGVFWVGFFIFGGYAFGNIALIKENFGIVTLIIILLSFVPVVYEYVKHKRLKQQTKMDAKIL